MYLEPVARIHWDRMLSRALTIILAFNHYAMNLLQKSGESNTLRYFLQETIPEPSSPPTSLSVRYISADSKTQNKIITCSQCTQAYSKFRSMFHHCSGGAAQFSLCYVFCTGSVTPYLQPTTQPPKIKTLSMGD